MPCCVVLWYVRFTNYTSTLKIRFSPPPIIVNNHVDFFQGILLLEGNKKIHISMYY